MMSIYEAMVRLSELNNSVVQNPLIDHKTRHLMSEAIDLAQGALKTIEDGQYMKRKLNAVYGTLVSKYVDTDSTRNNDIDLKTLYEQTTMYCDLIANSSDYKYNIEIYQRPNTPIKVFVYWSKKLHKITSINYTIKGEKP